MPQGASTERPSCNDRALGAGACRCTAWSAPAGRGGQVAGRGGQVAAPGAAVKWPCLPSALQSPHVLFCPFYKMLLTGICGGSGPGGGSGGSGCTGSTAEPGSTTITGAIPTFLLLARSCDHCGGFGLRRAGGWCASEILVPRRPGTHFRDRPAAARRVPRGRSRIGRPSQPRSRGTSAG